MINDVTDFVNGFRDNDNGIFISSSRRVDISNSLKQLLGDKWIHKKTIPASSNHWLKYDQAWYFNEFNWEIELSISEYLDDYYLIKNCFTKSYLDDSIYGYIINHHLIDGRDGIKYFLSEFLLELIEKSHIEGYVHFL